RRDRRGLARGCAAEERDARVDDPAEPEEVSGLAAVLAQRGREDEREERDADRTPAEGPAAGRERRRPGGEQEEGGEEPARDEERRADVRERRPELRADSVPGAI